MSWLRRLETKAADVFTPTTAQFDSPFLPLTRVHYGRLLRNGIDSNVIMAPVQWIMRAFPEAEVVVDRRMGGKPWQIVEDHPLQDLLVNPNEGYDGASMIQATALSYVMDGNAYWVKRRNAFGRVLEYWYVPHWLIQPRWPGDGSAFISDYLYQPIDAPSEELDPSDVVHFRFGIDPRNTRMGLSQLKTLMREVFVDEEAASFSATILKNMGVPGLMISPKNPGAELSEEDAKEMKREVDGKFRGDGRGGTLVMSEPTKVEQFGFAPQQLDLTGLGDRAEERVCAALGLPAAVVGFGAGLQATKVGATMREMRQLAWNQCIIPLQSSLARQMTKQLIPDFENLSPRWRVRFDRSGVSAFQEEETEKAKRIATLVLAGVLRVDKAQEAAGLEVDTSQNVYLRPTASVAVAEGDDGIVDEQLPNPPAAPGIDPSTIPEPGGKSVLADAARVLERMNGRVSGNGKSNGDSGVPHPTGSVS